eukprot:CAMPEP_0180550380 /NCGR_PEP_ID=MMETSP1036_2-20121128/72611_1 /TAXON_ID=632150 /ORGANISM="Azadinium spinosum, Strain 3D9" /LENGTH=56 /DNA_ID=CAMNT_0022565623 /DNA_START=120 /DNA_END=287 /DNA_ORIENTATION=-
MVTRALVVHEAECQGPLPPDLLYPRDHIFDLASPHLHVAEEHAKIDDVSGHKGVDG